MMALVKEGARRAIQIPVAWLAAVIVPGFGFAWWAIMLLLQMNTAWNNTAATLEQLKRETAALTQEQAAGRARGDNRQNQINVLDRQVAVITSTLADLREGVAAGNRKLDRIIEQKFGVIEPN